MTAKKGADIIIPQHGNAEEGYLSALEKGKAVDPRPFPLPFDVKRVFYIFGVPQGGKRGGHAHYEGEQFFVCLAGSVSISHEGFDEHGCRDLSEITLLPPLHPGTAQTRHWGLYVPAGLWVEIEVTAPDTILLCLCSNYYDEGDYIRDREAWEREFASQKKE